MVDWVSFSVAVVAVGIALLGWWESRRHSQLFESMAKSLAFIAQSRRPHAKRRTKPVPGPASPAPAAVPAEGSGRISATATVVAIPPLTPAERLRMQTEERQRLRLELEREKEQWRRQKDIAKAIGWVLDRIGSDDEDEYEEE